MENSSITQYIYCEVCDETLTLCFHIKSWPLSMVLQTRQVFLKKQYVIVNGSFLLINREYKCIHYINVISFILSPCSSVGMVVRRTNTLVTATLAFLILEGTKVGNEQHFSIFNAFCAFDSYVCRVPSFYTGTRKWSKHTENNVWTTKDRKSAW